ncbi:hypothetical protein, partial [Salinivibrio sp. SS3]|uniref:hypothetical protein n=1 Tax=Salinivibrio sp. SS3 TaxID=1895021 RepID=UPI001C401C4E
MYNGSESLRRQVIEAKRAQCWFRHKKSPDREVRALYFLIKVLRISALMIKSVFAFRFFQKSENKKASLAMSYSHMGTP